MSPIKRSSNAAEALEVIEAEARSEKFALDPALSTAKQLVYVHIDATDKEEIFTIELITENRAALRSILASDSAFKIILGDKSGGSSGNYLPPQRAANFIHRHIMSHISN
jgi:hypothetical protein